MSTVDASSKHGGGQTCREVVEFMPPFGRQIHELVRLLVGGFGAIGSGKERVAETDRHDLVRIPRAGEVHDVARSIDDQPGRVRDPEHRLDRSALGREPDHQQGHAVSIVNPSFFITELRKGGQMLAARCMHLRAPAADFCDNVGPCRSTSPARPARPHR